MKRLLPALAILFAAGTVFAQEIDLGLGGDVGGLLNIPAPSGNRGGPPRGAAPPGPARGAAATAPPVDRLVRLRELLAAANTPLTREQETGLNALLNAEIPAMRRTLQARALDLQRAKGGPPAAAADAPPPPPQTAGPRGAPPNLNLPGMEELAPEIIRLNDELLGKIADAPELTPQQRGLLKKSYKDQVKSRGGFAAIKLTMEEAGTPFSAEQIAQIQPLFDQQEQARIQLLQETPGQPPDKARMDQLQRETLAKLLKLLRAEQRSALVAAPPKPQP